MSDIPIDQYQWFSTEIGFIHHQISRMNIIVTENWNLAILMMISNKFLGPFNIPIIFLIEAQIYKVRKIGFCLHIVTF